MHNCLPPCHHFQPQTYRWHPGLYDPALTVQSNRQKLCSSRRKVSSFLTNKIYDLIWFISTLIGWIANDVHRPEYLKAQGKIVLLVLKLGCWWPITIENFVTAGFQYCSNQAVGSESFNSANLKRCWSKKRSIELIPVQKLNWRKKWQFYRSFFNLFISNTDIWKCSGSTCLFESRCKFASSARF